MILFARYSRKKCSFGGVISVKDELIFFSDIPGNRVHVIDVEKQEVRLGITIYLHNDISGAPLYIAHQEK